MTTIREEREKKGLSQKDLAMEFCISQQNVSYIEKHGTNNIRQARKIAAFFGLTIEDFKEFNNFPSWEKQILEFSISKEFNDNRDLDCAYSLIKNEPGIFELKAIETDSIIIFSLKCLRQDYLRKLKHCKVMILDDNIMDSLIIIKRSDLVNFYENN